MTKSILTFALVLGLSAGLAAAARADQSTPPAPTMPQTTAQLPTQPAESPAVEAYDKNINPLAVTHPASPYDLSDAFTTPEGAPLPGWGPVAGYKP